MGITGPKSVGEDGQLWEISENKKRDCAWVFRVGVVVLARGSSTFICSGLKGGVKG